MSMTVSGYAALSATALVAPWEFKRRTAAKRP